MAVIQLQVAVNEKGYRIGQDHHQAKLTDAEIDLLLTLHHVDKWGYGRLAAKFEISKGMARKYCKGKCRSQTIAGFKMVLIRRVEHADEKET